MAKQNLKKRYNQHYVKRNPSNQKFEFDENGNAVPGDFIRDVTLIESTVELLNEQSEQHGFVWVPVEKSNHADHKIEPKKINKPIKKEE
jgi:hypothetical protein